MDYGDNRVRLRKAPLLVLRSRNMGAVGVIWLVSSGEALRVNN